MQHGPGMISGRDPALRVRKPPETHHYIGLDLGQSQDFTAVSVLAGTFTDDDQKPTYQCVHLERFALGTSYPDIVRAMVTLTERPELCGDWQLVVDATGVGRPVVDLLREAFGTLRRRVHPVSITGGGKVSASAYGLCVPKRDLVLTLKVLLESGRLEFAGKWPETADLIRETLAFQVKITNAANDTYGAWREGTHDDLVLSVALAAWYAERKARRSRVGGSFQG
jgi:Terminase RNaseH-like domain